MADGLKLKGDLEISREVNSKRSNERLTSETLAADRLVDAFETAWLSIDPDGADRVIELPDATALPNGWKQIVQHAGAANNLEVRSYDGTFTGTLLKTIEAPEAPNDTTAYQFVLIDNSTAAGVWYVVELGDSQNLVAQRFVVNFLTAAWPAAVAGKRTLTSTQAAGLAAATHGRGVTPMLMVQETIGTDNDRVMLDRERTDSAGNVTLRIIDGDQFDGRVVLI